jgi:CheY-like chemotaxis protein
MERRGFRVALAENGPEGLALADQLVPRAIVLDVRMPGMSGWDVLTALKLSERCAHVPVIMLSATPDTQLGRELGAIDHLVKPFDADALAATLRRHTRAAGARVLVVDDDEPTRELLARTLTRLGYAVVTAEDGLRALEALPRVRPDLVLLDLTMPVMDGFTFLDHLRADPVHAQIPVIVATARLLSDDDRGRLSTAQHVVEKTGHSLREVADTVGERIRTAIGA